MHYGLIFSFLFENFSKVFTTDFWWCLYTCCKKDHNSKQITRVGLLWTLVNFASLDMMAVFCLTQQVVLEPIGSNLSFCIDKCEAFSQKQCFHFLDSFWDFWSLCTLPVLPAQLHFYLSLHSLPVPLCLPKGGRAEMIQQKTYKCIYGTDLTSWLTSVAGSRSS